MNRTPGKALNLSSESKSRKGSTAATVGSPAPKKKSNVGIPISAAEVRMAFEFLDSDHKGYITIQDLRDKLGIFYRNLSTKDYKLLMNHKSELTEQDLYQLLANNELTDFDPVREAFKIYAPSDADIVEKDTLRDILTSLGFADLTDDDVSALLDALDSDGDGVVGQGDFIQLLKTNGANVLKKDPRRNMR